MIISPVQAFPINSEGFLDPVNGRCHIQKVWQKPLKEIVVACRSLFETNVSIYVRGSVASGTANIYFSDIDVMIITPKVSKEQLEKIDEVAKTLELRYPIATGIDLEVMTDEEVQNDKSLQLRISTEAIHLNGEHHWAEKMRFKPSKEIRRHAPTFSATFLKVPKELLKSHELDDLQKRIVRAAKQLIRLGMELVIEKSKAYSRDLQVCIQIFSSFYPEKEKSMIYAQEYVKRGNFLERVDKDSFIELWNKLGEWLCCRLKDESLLEQQSK